MEELTKKKFKFIPNSEIISNAKLKMARKEMENHIVYTRRAWVKGLIK